jgi:hypothetical protein
VKLSARVGRLEKDRFILLDHKWHYPGESSDPHQENPLVRTPRVFQNIDVIPGDDFIRDLPE